jgi:outer membrane protein OmpA-like peptidoglycan-associated protein
MGEHRTATGAVTGAAIGGGAGALIDKDNPFRGALIGAIAGSAVGAGVGHMLQRQKEAFERIEQLEVQQETVIIQQPPQVSEDQQTVQPGPSQQAQAILVRVPAEILFDKASATLSPHGAGKLREVAQVLKEYPESDVYIRGYTSSEGDLQYNYKLSQQRADSVRFELISVGVSGSRLYAEGLGPTNPVATNDTEGGRAQNRRVELHVVPRT